MNLTIDRHYNSTGTFSGINVGQNWTLGFDYGLNVDSAVWVHLMRPDGKVFSFKPASGGYVPADKDINDSLVELKDESGARIGWQYTEAASGQVEQYSPAGKVVARRDRAGYEQRYTYSDESTPGSIAPVSGLLIEASDNLGRSVQVSYQKALFKPFSTTGGQPVYRVQFITDPAGRIISYAYDNLGNLTSVTYPDGRSRTYHYNESAYTSGASLPFALTGITDENGDRYATYQYQADGKAISTGHAGGADLHTLTYNPDGTTAVTDPLGTARTHNFTTILGVVKSTGQSQPGGSGCGPASSATTYDANGNVASRADFNGHKTCYAYDLTRNIETARLEGLASGSACPADIAGYTPAANTAERKILTQWDPRFRLPAKVTEAGRETGTVYDSHGNVTSRSIEDLATGKTRTWTTAYTYHASVPGVLVRKVENGPRTDVSDLTTTDYYAPDENCLGGHYGCRGQVKQVANALGHITTYDEYDAHGRVTRSTDPNGLVTRMRYTPRGWLETRDVGGELTRFDYDGVGQVIKVTRPDGSHVGFEYDPAHRLTAIVAQDGSRLAYTLDPAGNRIREDITRPDGTTVYYTHRREFDALGRLWRDIGAYNQTTTYAYDAKGNLKQADGARTDVTDVTRHDYDPLDRLTRTLNADGGIEQYAANALDQTTRVVDPADQATAYAVNAFGDVTRTDSADSGTTTRTYDEAGNLKTETDARGVTVTYTYDALNRLTKTQTSDAATPVYTYFYDSCSNKGRLCYIQRNGTVHLIFNHDLHGRKTYQLNAVPDESLLYSQYTYDAYGRLEKITYPTGRSVSYGHDAQGRVSQVSTQPASGTPVTLLASGFAYVYPFAGPLSFTYGSGGSAYQNRDLDYRPLVRIDGPYGRFHTYDAAGNVERLADSGNRLLSYAYDATGRLAGATDANSFGALAWTYDLNGNRQTETRNGSTLDYLYSPAGSNWLYQFGSEYRIDGMNGNTAFGTSTGFLGYDGYNRLVQSSKENTRYTYDALGRRIRKANQNGLSTIFHYGQNGELLFEKDQSGNTKAYVWLDGRPLARIDNNKQIYYYHVDHLGTPQAMTNSTGAVVWKADYEPFGKATVSPASTVENNLRFPGQYYDRETGLHYNYFRDYDPRTGRYVEVDPIGVVLYRDMAARNLAMAGPASLELAAQFYSSVPIYNQLYTYVGANPINRSDQSGLFWDENGNIISGSHAQNWKCDIPPLLGGNVANSNRCYLDCCVDHDSCFERNGCNASSLGRSGILEKTACAKCNHEVIKCFIKVRKEGCPECGKAGGGK